MTAADRQWESAEQAAVCFREKSQAQRKAIEILHDGKDPLDFVRYRMAYLVALLYACASEDVANAISAAEKVKLAFLAHELAQEVEIAIDLLPTPAQKGGEA